MRRLGDPRDALGLLTIVPMRRPLDGDSGRDVAAWFPLVGLLLGAFAIAVTALVVGASVALSDGWVLGRTGFVVAALIVGAWAMTTRFLHWDGLADTADAVWGGHTTARRLEIMHDSSVGAFGVTAVVLVIAVQVASLGALLSYAAPWVWVSALVTAPVLGRVSATFACWLGTPARPDGLGRSVIGPPSAAGIALLVVLLGALTGVLVQSETLRWIVWWPVTILLTPVVPHLLARSVGGVTGDNLGATIVCVEAIVLVAAALVGGL